MSDSSIFSVGPWRLACQVKSQSKSMQIMSLTYVSIGVNMQIEQNYCRSLSGGKIKTFEDLLFLCKL